MFAVSLKHPATYSHSSDLRQLANGIGKGDVGAGRNNLNGNGYKGAMRQGQNNNCLLYTSDAADVYSV